MCPGLEQAALSSGGYGKAFPRGRNRRKLPRSRWPSSAAAEPVRFSLTSAAFSTQQEKVLEDQLEARGTGAPG